VIVEAIVKVGSRGPSDTLYSFFADSEMNLKEGDTVVVDTRNGLQVATVREIDVIDQASVGVASKWVVDKVDLSAHEARIERQKRMKSVLAKLRARRKDFEEMALSEVLADKDNEVAELLKGLKELQG